MVGFLLLRDGHPIGGAADDQVGRRRHRRRRGRGLRRGRGAAAVVVVHRPSGREGERGGGGELGRMDGRQLHDGRRRDRRLLTAATAATADAVGGVDHDDCGQSGRNVNRRCRSFYDLSASPATCPACGCRTRLLFGECGHSLNGSRNRSRFAERRCPAKR